MSYVPITDAHLVMTALLFAMAAGISAVFRLGLFKSLAWAAVRCVVQLTVIGYALAWLFAIDRIELVILLVAVMCVIAAQTATRRTPNVTDFPTIIGFISLAASTYLIMVIVCGLIIQAQPWYTARIVVPIAGMILGNAVNGIALSIDRLYAEVRSRKDRIEAMLCLGGHAVGSSAGLRSRSTPSRHDSYNEYHDGRRCRQYPRYDGQPDPRRSRSHRSIPIPNRGAAHDCGSGRSGQHHPRWPLLPSTLHSR